ncbi:hypothetical protein I6Y99_004343 [Vibrio parahaemolyticus]|nr:hypothetical protein [Vibrio parahaemolyticus]
MKELIELVVTVSPQGRITVVETIQCAGYSARNGFVPSLSRQHIGTTCVMNNVPLPRAGIYVLKGSTIDFCRNTNVWFVCGNLIDAPMYCEARTTYQGLEELAGHWDLVKNRLLAMKAEGKTLDEACCLIFGSNP